MASKGKIFLLTSIFIGRARSMKSTDSIPTRVQAFSSSFLLLHRLRQAFFACSRLPSTENVRFGPKVGATLFPLPASCSPASGSLPLAALCAQGSGIRSAARCGSTRIPGSDDLVAGSCLRHSRYERTAPAPQNKRHVRFLAHAGIAPFNLLTCPPGLLDERRSDSPTPLILGLRC